MESLPAELIVCIADYLPKVNEYGHPSGSDLYHLARASRRFWTIIRPLLYRNLELRIWKPKNHRLSDPGEPDQLPRSNLNILRANEAYTKHLTLYVFSENKYEADPIVYAEKAEKLIPAVLQSFKSLESFEVYNNASSAEFLTTLLISIANVIRYQSKLKTLDLSLGHINRGSYIVPLPLDLPTIARLRKLRIMCSRRDLEAVPQIIDTLGPAVESVTEAYFCLYFFAFLEPPWKNLDRVFRFTNLVSLTIDGPMKGRAISIMTILKFDCPNLRELTVMLRDYVIDYHGTKRTLEDLPFQFSNIETLRLDFIPFHEPPKRLFDHLEEDILPELAARLTNLKNFMMRLSEGTGSGQRPSTRYYAVRKEIGGSSNAIQRVNYKTC